MKIWVSPTRILVAPKKNWGSPTKILGSPMKIWGSSTKIRGLQRKHGVFNEDMGSPTRRPWGCPINGVSYSTPMSISSSQTR